MCENTQLQTINTEAWILNWLLLLKENFCSVIRMTLKYDCPTDNNSALVQLLPSQWLLAKPVVGYVMSECITRPWCAKCRHQLHFGRLHTQLFISENMKIFKVLTCGFLNCYVIYLFIMGATSYRRYLTSFSCHVFLYNKNEWVTDQAAYLCMRFCGTLFLASCHVQDGGSVTFFEWVLAICTPAQLCFLILEWC